MGKRVVALAAGYSHEDRATILEFLTKACEILEEETIRLRAPRIMDTFSGAGRAGTRSRKRE
jgi:hypothetical protein